MSCSKPCLQGVSVPGIAMDQSQRLLPSRKSVLGILVRNFQCQYKTFCRRQKGLWNCYVNLIWTKWHWYGVFCRCHRYIDIVTNKFEQCLRHQSMIPAFSILSFLRKSVACQQLTFQTDSGMVGHSDFSTTLTFMRIWDLLLIYFQHRRWKVESIFRRQETSIANGSHL